MAEKILIYDFGSQYTQLIARAVREAGVFCEIFPFNKELSFTSDIKGFILSGSPCSVNQKDPPVLNIELLTQYAPVLGICYGAQLTAKLYGGNVEKSDKREYGRANLKISKFEKLFSGIPESSQVWMSHSDSITQIPKDFEILATTSDIPIAAFRSVKKELYGLQFHPEVFHSTEGKRIIKNFLFNICSCKGEWTPANFISEQVNILKQKLGSSKVVMALSGGVDSTVAATLLHKAIGDNLYGIFVDNGLLRKNEFEDVLSIYKTLGLNVKGVDAKIHFYKALDGKILPEEKRKAIGKSFIEIFDIEAHKIKDIEYLGQGTIYPDVIESVSVHGPSVTIKSHHNVGGLPEKMHLKLVEPLRNLFKDEVRRIGKELGIPDEMLSRHPFPGPGLGIRILGEVNSDKVQLLQEADNIYITLLKEFGLYNAVWQAGAILLPVKSVGVMGDERTYEYTIALRAVTSVDGMTADWAHLPYEFLAEVSNKIINNVKGINRVVYDISSKPPATIEWE
ncbi:MAG: glutamine-hydrolyzing GMP synthase [Bacteroidetes bacterium]|nr:glutamine-hydrolyzing GMP synthase [Bacteroidota bacterium]